MLILHHMGEEHFDQGKWMLADGQILWNIICCPQKSCLCVIPESEESDQLGDLIG